MTNLTDIQSQYDADLDATEQWCNEIYESQFSRFFSTQRKLFDRMKSKSRPITDTELEWILTEVPMNLFDASEVLNTFQMKEEVIKLQLKHKEVELMKQSKESSQDRKREAVSDELLGDKVLLLAYNNVISRVEKEMSYSRELIMSAKKIYDRRKETEQSNPVSEVSTKDDLPDYMPSPKTYIK